jgi:hypothetical protein
MKALVLAALGAAVVAGSALADETRISFPQGYLNWSSFGAIDRYDRKSVRSFYVNPDALAKSMPGKPAPDGSQKPGELRKLEVKKEGTFDVECVFHPEMVTKVTVSK